MDRAPLDTNEAKLVQCGFTIVELLIVIVVIAILAAISVVAYTGILDRTHDSVVQSDLRQTFMKTEEYRIINDVMPTLMVDSSDIDMRDTARATVNEVLVIYDRAAYEGFIEHNVLFCRSDDALAVVAHSRSGNTYYHSSVNGAGRIEGLTTSTQVQNTHGCPQAGIETTAPGYRWSWVYVNGNWRNWFGA